MTSSRVLVEFGTFVCVICADMYDTCMCVSALFCFVFSIPFVVAALLVLLLPPSRNSDLGSRIRIFSLVPTAVLDESQPPPHVGCGERNCVSIQVGGVGGNTHHWVLCWNDR